ncbi:hypothetical protein G5I_04478 [Acromyrmex echinatior]|uniref:Peptidase M41 FtsH extracellular domain-containing protein n=1 Tax=Acromyrmex echinatior TaxID=103372 RepID=F4WFR9_ACREC|nr:hypothetical protein G5I_04478 [Acromyrmex echinatior]
MKDIKVLLFVFGVILFLEIIIPTESASQDEKYSYADFLKNITDLGTKEIDNLMMVQKEAKMSFVLIVQGVSHKYAIPTMTPAITFRVQDHANF